MSPQKNSNNTNRSTCSQESEDSRSPSNGSTLGQIAASLRADFHAKTSQPPVREQDSMATEVDYGGKRLPPSAWFDLSSSSWRMFQRCLLEGWTLFSDRWPRSGIMLNGIAYRLPTLAHRTGGIGSGLSESGEMWQTPSAMVIANRSEESMRKRAAYRASIGRRTVPPGNLAEQVQYGKPTTNMKIWPTPRSHPIMANQKITPELGQRGKGNLEEEVARQMWPTPMAADATQYRTPKEHYQRQKKKKAANPKLGELHKPLITAILERQMWPTPVAYDATPGGPNNHYKGLGHMAKHNPKKMWPTPMTTGLDGGSSSRAAAKARGFWPTPSASDHKGSGPTLIRKDGKDRSFDRVDYATEQAPDKGGGALSADWVSILMGYSLDWTTTAEDGSAGCQGSQEGKKTGPKD